MVAVAPGDTDLRLLVLPGYRTAPTETTKPEGVAMSTKELHDRIGTRGFLTLLEGLSFPVKVLDAREVFGRVDVLVTPVGGTGERWVAESSVTA